MLFKTPLIWPWTIWTSRYTIYPPGAGEVAGVHAWRLGLPAHPGGRAEALPADRRQGRHQGQGPAAGRHWRAGVHYWSCSCKNWTFFTCIVDDHISWRPMLLTTAIAAGQCGPHSHSNGRSGDVVSGKLTLNTPTPNTLHPTICRPQCPLF